MANNLTFTAWQRSRLFDRAVPQDTRLGSSVTLTLRDTETGQDASGNAPFELLAAADIAGLKPGAIKHMAPAPFAHDAETTKFVHVDLREPDLPWRYTPQVNEPNLRPWLVLLVGTGEEIAVSGGIANVQASVLQAHPLSQSHCWAHTQFDGHNTIGRILSPQKLLPQREYVAVLVPAFNDTGRDMWHDDGTTNFGRRGVLPAFHHWRFWTAEAGDFETLAAALHIPPAGDVGKARLHYRRIIPEDGVNIDETLEVRGAITSLQDEENLDPAALARVRADLDALNDAIEGAIGLPHYGRPWLPDPDASPNGWPADLNDDPRFRSLTGLGTWMGVEAQEALMDAAVKQAGALREAGQRIGFLALGLWAGGRLWDRRLPTDKNERLRILGPLMGRMIAADNGIVLNRVTAGSSPLVPAIFSSVAQRLLRDRSNHTRHVSGAAGGLDRRAALDAANRPEAQPERTPAGLPHFDVVAKKMGLPPLAEMLQIDPAGIDDEVNRLFEAVQWGIDDYRQQRNELLRDGHIEELRQLARERAEQIFGDFLGELTHWLDEQGRPCDALEILSQLAGRLQIMPPHELFRSALDDDDALLDLREAFEQELRHCFGRRACRELIGHWDLPNRATFCDELLDTLPPEPPPQQKSVDLGLLSDRLHAALDPRQPNPPAQVRLCQRLQGIDCARLIPPEFPIGLDFPTWSLLKQYDKEWLLPGADTLEKDSITALQTNPAFIDAYMVGINTQFMAEMRWRDLAVDRYSTPLRMFWGQVNYATQQRQADIQPLGEWAKVPADPVGALTHQSIQPDDPGNATGSRLIITFRSDLFRRYPSTLVYLVRPPAGADDAAVDALLQQTPQLEHAAGDRANRRFFGPTFSGTLAPDLTFFAFDVTPSALDQYWLVLDEPPAELRFRSDAAANAANSATFARTTLDQPTRIAISGAELERQGLNP